MFRRGVPRGCCVSYEGARMLDVWFGFDISITVCISGSVEFERTADWVNATFLATPEEDRQNDYEDSDYGGGYPSSDRPTMGRLYVG